MRSDYVIAALNALVTPTAIQTKAEIVSIAIRHCWAGCCRSCSPTSNHASWLVGHPHLWPCFISWIVPSAISSAWDSPLLTVTWLRPTSHSGLSLSGVYSGKSPQISQFKLDDSPPTPIIISPLTLHFSFLALTAVCNYV